MGRGLSRCMFHRCIFHSFAGILMLVLSALAAQAKPTEPTDEVESSAVGEEGGDAPLDGAFSDSVTVSETSAVVRIVTRRGEPLLGLGPEDLRVTVGRQPVEILGLDWVGPEMEEVATEGPSPIGRPADLTRPAPALEEIAPPLDEGRLVVIFVQIGHHMVVTFEPTIVRGHLRLLPSLRRMVDGFADADWIAVASFDSNLELWLDFTRDREAVAQALFDAIGYTEAVPRRNQGGPSLFPAFDLEAAREATSTDEALLLLARALEPLPGVKDIVYSGWGVGRLTAGIGVHFSNDAESALAVLARAETMVSVLDVTQADQHLLAGGLMALANATGGSYQATFDFPRSKVERLGRALVGYYQITIDTSSLEADGGPLRIHYPADSDVRVLYRDRVLQPNG